MNDVRIRIQNALVDRALSADFYPVRYDSETSHAEPVLSPVKPSEALANEIDATFSRPPRYRRDFQISRETWSFQLILGFDCEVVLTAFEDSVMQNPPTVERDLENNVPLVLLELLEVEYEHRPQQSESAGTQVRYTFNAVPESGIN